MIVKTLLVVHIISTGLVKEIPWPGGFEDCVAFSAALNPATTLVKYDCITTVTEPEAVNL